jgi:hypothetical protein
MTAKVGASGKITDALMARVMLKVRDTTAAPVAVWEPTFGSRQAYVDSGASGGLANLGHDSEGVWLDEACLDYNMSVWPKAHVVFGRQFQSYGMGLLVNNSRQSQQGLRLAWTDLFKTNLNLEGFVGGSTYTFGANNVNEWGDGVDADSVPNKAGDGYISGRVSYDRPNFRLAGSWLADGFGSERGWGIDGWARFWGGREIQAEFGTLTQALDGTSYPHSNPMGIMGSVDIWKGKSWGLKGLYSQADAEYSPWYSSVNPYFESYGGSDNGQAWLQWGRALDNPLVLPNVRAIGGTLDVNWAKADWQAMYYNLDNLSDFWGHTNWYNLNPVGVPYNQLWAVRVRKEIANGVNLNLTYATQILNDDSTVGNSSLDDLGYKNAQLLMAGIAVGF